MDDCTILRKLSLRALELLSHRAIDKKVDEVGKQEWKEREEMARIIRS